MSKALQEKAREILETKKADVIVGHGEGSSKGRTRPVFITSPSDVGRLTLEGSMANNLAMYIMRHEVSGLGRIAVVSRPREIKAIVGLVQEFQITKDDITIIGVKCDASGNPDKSGEVYSETTLDEHVKILKEKHLKDEFKEDFLKEIETFEKMNDEDKWKFWQEQFSRCIKCYACREACPLCYCKRCIVEKNQPQWVDTSAHQKGQYSWNITRAFHLTGRCIGCDACYLACPMNIPIYLLNRSMAKKMKDIYNYIAGYDFEKNPPMLSFELEDKEEFIK